MNRKISSLLNQQIKQRLKIQIALFALAVFCSPGQVFAQNEFNSGSTGADGELAPTSNVTLQLPESGVFNFTNVNIPSGVTVTFTPNSQNTPVTLLASGNVTIAGTIVLTGETGLSTGVGGKGGPGGAKGGNGGLLVDNFTGTAGEGPGGGYGGASLGTGLTGTSGGGGGGYAALGNNATGNYAVAPYGVGGPAYGTSSLLPLIGGSGGGGGGSDSSGYRGGAGGGGGGAIVIASSGTITLSGSISARGGNGANVYKGGAGGAGSGGAIRLIANTITGTGSLDVRGGTQGFITHSGSSGGAGGKGFIRTETYDYSSFNPNTNTVALNITLPNPVTAPSNPQIRIASIAGVPTPLNPKASLQSTPDIVLPGSLSNPAEVVIEAANVPVDSVVQVTVTPPIGSRTVFQSTALSGTESSSTATASINLPSGMSVITVTLTINLQVAKLKPIYINGEKVNSIELAANLGGESETVYITNSGKRLKFPIISQ